jgi:transposase-like protein
VPFLAYPVEVRGILYTTNAIESLNSLLRKVVRYRGPFPNDEAVFKLFFLAIQRSRYEPTHMRDRHSLIIGRGVAGLLRPAPVRPAKP